jgi:hypothetical protein
VEPTGVTTYVAAHVADVQIGALITERQQLSPDQFIDLFPQLQYVHLFESETVARIG